MNIIFTHIILLSLLVKYFQLPHSVSNALGFFITAGISEAILGLFFASLLRKIPYKFWKAKWANFVGVIPALGQGIIITAFMLTLVVSLPVSPIIKRDVTKSKIGSYLVQKTTSFEAKLNDVFGGLAEDALTYLTVKPESRESIKLNSELGLLSVDAQAESDMFKMVNAERAKVGSPQLTWRIELVPVARGHAKDMWERNYFGHVSPEGKDVGGRLEDAGVKFMLAGENLALAPTLQTAHSGLMNSEGHRRNILDPEFKRIGIGVIDNGIYGKMFVQIFTD